MVFQKKINIYLILFLFCGLISLLGCGEDEKIDETPPDIACGMEDLIGKFKLDGDADDTSTSLNQGQIIGTIPAVENRKEVPNSAMSFKNNLGYIEIGDVEELKITDAMSMSFWIKLDSVRTNVWESIINKWKNEDDAIESSGYYFGVHGNISTVPILRWRVNFSRIDVGIGTLDWTHIVVTLKDDIIKFYGDGVFIDEKELFNSLMDTNVPFRIGEISDDSFQSGFNGLIDDLYIFNRELSESEILELFNE